MCPQKHNVAHPTMGCTFVQSASLDWPVYRHTSFLLLVLLTVTTVVCDVTNWSPWVALNEPRTNAQAHIISHFVFLVGGTKVPYSLNNISSGAFQGVVNNSNLSSSSRVNNHDGIVEDAVEVEETAAASASSPLSSSANPAGISVTSVIDFMDFNHVYKWQQLPLDGFSLVPISAKSGSVATNRSIFISYAADILRLENNAFVEVRLPNPVSAISTTAVSGWPGMTLQPATVHQHAGSIIYRNAAALAKMERVQPPHATPFDDGVDSTLDILPSVTYTFYIFGGRTSKSVPTPEVEMFVNKSWTVVATMNISDAVWMCNCAANQPGVTSSYIVLSGCLHCQTGEATPFTVVFDAMMNAFLPTQHSPRSYYNPNYLPSFNGASMSMLMQFQPTVYEVVGPYGPVINMYDSLLHQENEIITVDIQQRRTECAQFNSMASVFCIGGTSFPDRSAAVVYTDTTAVYPSPEVSFDHTYGVYAPGEDITVYAGLTCGTSTASFRLTIDPQCQVPVPFVKDVPCAAASTFATSESIVLRAGQSLDVYLCYTEGSCSARGSERVPCGHGLTNDDCRWFPCCWDNEAQSCYAFTAATPETQSSTFWTNAIASPIVFYSPPASPPPPPPWYKSTGFIIGFTIGGVVILYFAISLLWKSRVQQEAKTRQTLQSSLFTAFGKNYSVIGQIGQGSFGTVFLAERMSDHKKVALKVLPCDDAKQRNVALAEYDVLHNLKHDNLIRVLDLILNWDSASGIERNSDERKRRRIGKRSPNYKRSTRRLRDGEAEPLVNEVSINSDDLPTTARRNDGPSSTGSDTTGRTSAEELMKGPLIQQPLLGVAATVSGRDSQLSTPTSESPNNLSSATIKVYGSFAQNVNFATAGESVARRDLEFIAACPRFICLVSDYYPDGDLRDFVLNYGLPKSARKSHDESLLTSCSSGGGGGGGGGKTPMKNQTSSSPPPSSSGGRGGDVAVPVVNMTVIPERLVRSFAQQLCSLMQYMHVRKKPIIHRDLKPENVLMNGERLVVTDFGLAGVQDRDAYMTTRAGTLFFSPPESFTMQVTVQSDMWAVGCILYAVCTRRVLPETARIMFSDVDDDDFEESMRSDLASYSKALQDLILGLLVKDPARRLTADQARRFVDSMPAI